MDKRPELMTKSSFRKFWNSIKRVLHLELPVGETLELTTRVFRYNYATMPYYAGVDLKEAQRLLGHSKITITLEIYTALNTKQSNSAERLEEYLAKVYNLYQKEEQQKQLIF